MSKRFSEDEDKYLHAFSGVGEFHMARDLRRTQVAVKNRIRHLKGTGAWQALDDMAKSELQYRRLSGRLIKEFYEHEAAPAL